MQVFGAAPVHKDSALYALKEAGKRMAGTLNLHLAAGVTRGFAAFRLTDGTSDGTVYDCRADAIRHQLHETLCWYESLRPRSFGADECALTLAYARAAYDAGWRNPADAPAPIKPVRLEDFVAKTRQLRRHARSH